MPPFRMSQDFQGFPSLIFTVELLGFLLSPGADPAPVVHQMYGSEQIPFDHEAVEAPDRACAAPDDA
jgi:hypothetical protein